MRLNSRVVPRLFLAVVLALLGTFLVVPQSSAAVIGDDYPAGLKKYARDAKVDPWRFYNRECTSFVAWRITHELKFTVFDDYWLVHWGNASNWKKAATSTAVRKAGVTVDNVPSVGAVAWWGAHSAGSSLGHVAWVASVSASSITVEEYNYASPGRYGTRVIGTSSTKWPGAFIHFVPTRITNTTPPAITGTAKVGKKLTAAAGSWSVPSLTYSYQWLAGGVAVAGATARTFKPRASQLAEPIAVKVTASRSGLRSVSKKSAATAAVAPGTFAVSSPPTITGTPKVGHALVAGVGTWQPSGAHGYQWSADGVAIAGATGATYTPGPADVAKEITVSVSGTRAGYTTRSVRSASSAAVDKGAFVQRSAATVVGAPRVGASVTASPGTWSPAGSYRYQWLRDGVAIPGATNPAYTPVAADLSKPLSVRIGVRSAGYRNGQAISPTRIVGPGRFLARVAPTIVGRPQVGRTVSLDAGSWAPTPGSLTRQWYVGGKAVPGATGTTLRLGPADLGKTVTARVVVQKRAYVGSSAVAGANGTVAAGVNVPTSPPGITGRALRGKVLSVTPAAWEVGPKVRHYQWYADSTAIKGATGKTLTLHTGQVGKHITVVEYAWSKGYHTARAVSASSRPVRYGKIRFTKAPTVSGSTAVGSMLTAHPGRTQVHARMTYQWYRSGAPVAGATQRSYRTSAADLGRLLSVRVQATAPWWAGNHRRAAVAAPVRTRPTMRITSTVGGAHGHRLTMTVRVTSAMVPRPGGVMELRDGRRHLARSHVVDGVARLRVARMPSGLRRVEVHYSGTAKVFSMWVHRRL